MNTTTDYIQSLHDTFFQVCFRLHSKKHADLPKRGKYGDWKNAAISNGEFVQTDSYIVLALGALRSDCVAIVPWIIDQFYLQRCQNKRSK